MVTVSSPIVVKVGGSLYELPGLGKRLSAWLASQSGDIILVPGGGPMVDTIRQLDLIHHLGEEACHWLAIRTLTINAHFLAQLLPGVNIISDPKQQPAGHVSIMDMYPFALTDEANSKRLPHSWEVTSDSLAARVAIVAQARKLVLLKSVDAPVGLHWSTWPEEIVDGHFREIMGQASADLLVEIVNLRSARRAGEKEPHTK